MIALAIALPNSSHFIYIPVIFILGIVIGFILGGKATRDELALKARQATEREARKAERAARRAASDGEP